MSKRLVFALSFSHDIFSIQKFFVQNCQYSRTEFLKRFFGIKRMTYNYLLKWSTLFLVKYFATFILSAFLKFLCVIKVVDSWSCRLTLTYVSWTPLSRIVSVVSCPPQIHVVEEQWRHMPAAAPWLSPPRLEMSSNLPLLHYPKQSCRELRLESG